MAFDINLDQPDGATDGLVEADRAHSHGVD